MEQIKSSIEMFLFLAVELSALFIGISFIVGILQHKIPAHKIEKMLGKGQMKSYLIAAAFGALTPFCSCSTIPMLRGMLRANAGFGPMMTFLFISPLLNPIIIGLLIVTFGWKLTVIYAFSALLVSFLASFLLDKLNFEKYVLKEEKQITVCEDNSCQIEQVANTCDEVPQPSCCSDSPVAPQSNKTLYKQIWKTALKDFKGISFYLFIGVLIGSVIYGAVPTEMLSKYAGDDNPFAIPVAAIIGIPLYIRAEAVIPLASVLMTKGMGAGTVLALIIGSAGASLTELILLRTIFKTKLILAFVVVILGMALFSGYVTYFIY